MTPLRGTQQKHLRLELSSTFDHLERAVEETRRLMEAVSANENLAYNVILLASEAVANAMEHGNDWNPDKNVILDIEINGDRIEVVVSDEGSGFASSSPGSPLEGDSLLCDRGRGLYFMEQMADEMHFDQDRHQLRLVFYRNK